jgi:hypothetical protein
VEAYAVGGSYLGNTAVDGSGAYFLDFLPPSTDVNLLFRGSSGGGWEWYNDATSRAGATPVTLGGAGITTTVDNELPAPITLSGSVVGYDGPLTLDNIGIDVYASGDGYYIGSTFANADGTYSLPSMTAGTAVKLTMWESGAPSGYAYHNGESLWDDASTIVIYGDRQVNLGWTTTSPFGDVPLAHAFATDIMWMFDSAISTGYGDGTFRPSANVSRQAMAAFMYRFAGSPAFTPPVTSPFNDVPTSSPFYTEICWMADQGITTGYPDGGFHPSANVSRQAMAAFMFRFAGSPAFTPPGTSPFVDVATDSPFYAEVTWMASTAITTGYADGGFHPTANVSRQAMAAFMHRLDGVLTAA